MAPTMIFIANSSKEGKSTSKGPEKRFVGDVYLDLIHNDEQNTIANGNNILAPGCLSWTPEGRRMRAHARCGLMLNEIVTFTPCARTNWHTHEGGQLIQCIAGSGWVCDRGASPKKLSVGDTVWCPPGTEHW